MSFVAVIAGAGAVYGGISANQARQQAKGAAGNTQGAVTDAEQEYQNLSPYRAMGLNDIQNASAQPDLSWMTKGGPQYAPVSSPLLTQGNNAQAATLNSLTNGPDYMAQAQQALSDFDAQQAPVLAAQRKAIGQSAASLGRIGSGGVTTSLGDLEGQYETNRMTTANQLISQALDQANQNKYQTLSAAQGVSNQAYNQGASERSNQQGVAQQGVANNEALNAAQQSAQGQNFNQGYQLSALGNNYNPAGVLLAAGQQQQNTANSTGNDAAGLLNIAGQIYARGSAPTVGTTVPTNADNYGY